MIILRYLFLIFLFSIPLTVIHSDSISENRKFSIYAKIPLVPKISIMEITTSLILENFEYFYQFNISSKNIVDFINQVDGNGEVEGIINNIYQPSYYEYKYTRKKKEKYVEIKYANNKVDKTVNLPAIDKSKLSPINEDMLVGTIDPSSFFLNLLDYKKTNKCKKTFKIYDGKRRYDVIFNNVSKNNKNKTIECEAQQIRLGGYKKDEKISDVFGSSDFIKIIYADSGNNEFIGYEAKNGKIKIIIKEIK